MRRKNGTLTRMIFVTCFLALCALVFGAVGVTLVKKELRTRSFKPVQAVITKSRIGVNTSGDSTTYYPDIQFEYTVDGTRYTTGTYRIVRISSSGRSGKERIVRRYPVGAKVQAWYDPEESSVAVLDRSISFLPLIFLGIGIIVLCVIIGMWVVYLIRGGVGARPGESRLFSFGARGAGGVAQHGAAGAERVVELEPHRGLGSQIRSPAGVLAFALLWNAIAFPVPFLLLFGDNPPPLIFRILLCVFPVAGVGLLVYAGCLLLAYLKVSRPHIFVSKQPLRLGDRFRLAFRQRAKSAADVKGIKLRLVCREVARYTVGTDSRTVTHDVFTQEHEICGSRHVLPGKEVEGELELQIPPDSMHTFKASNNQIVWLIEVDAEIRNWPDFKETYELLVAPVRAPAARA